MKPEVPVNKKAALKGGTNKQSDCRLINHPSEGLRGYIIITYSVMTLQAPVCLMSVFIDVSDNTYIV